MHSILIVGGLLLGLPVLLHLIMRQEPKRVAFPAFRLLQQIHKTNERKIRLRHLLLLALRMLLIALMALALFQPTLLSERFNFSSDQPVAAVLILDTSPSMGYVVADREFLDESRQKALDRLGEVAKGPWTLFDDARARALELLDELPNESRVALIETGDPLPIVRWPPTVDEVRRRILDLKKPSFSSLPVTRALDQALRLLKTVDAEQDAGAPPLPKMAVIFSDRTRTCWDPGAVEDLRKALADVPPPAVNVTFIDVGTDKPVNAGIVALEMKPQVLPSHREAKFSVTLLAQGKDFEGFVAVRFQGEDAVEKKPVKLTQGEPKSVEFVRKELAPGLHQAEIVLEPNDSLPADNAAFLTFRVREPRDVLAIVEDDKEAAELWRLAVNAGRSFRCEVVRRDEVSDWPAERWNKYEAVALFGLADPRQPPNKPLWKALEPYVRRGGNLLVFPPSDAVAVVEGYVQDEAAQRLMPGTLKGMVVAPNRGDVRWDRNTFNFNHPLLRPFRDWMLKGNIDFIKFEPRAYRWWEVQASPQTTVIVSYADRNRSPALLERQVDRGKVLLFTTGFDAATDESDRPFWNDYLQTSFFFVLTNLATAYLAGDGEDVVMNHTTGQSVVVKLPRSDEGGKKNYLLQGPGITGNDALLQPEGTSGAQGVALRLRIDPRRTALPGNYTVNAKNPTWQDGFGLNPPPEEGVLERLPLEAIEELLGKGSVVPTSKKVDVRDVLKDRFPQPVDLFPWLMLLVLFAFAFEGVLANRFYRKVPQVAAKV